MDHFIQHCESIGCDCSRLKTALNRAGAINWQAVEQIALQSIVDVLTKLLPLLGPKQ